MAGFMALVAPDIARRAGSGPSGLAEFVALAGAALYAVANVVTKRAPPLASVPAAFIMCASAALATALAAVIWSGPPGALSLGPPRRSCCWGSCRPRWAPSAMCG
jgi:drug/metabolite transporter (DMT)-like permease